MTSFRIWSRPVAERLPLTSWASAHPTSPAGAQYSFAQQLGDLEAVVVALALDKIIPVGHDAGGPAAVNFALKHPERTAAVTLMNAFYGAAPGLSVPELIVLFSNKELKALNLHFLASPQQFAWLLDFQRNQLQAGLTETQKIRYFEFLGPEGVC